MSSAGGGAAGGGGLTPTKNEELYADLNIETLTPEALKPLEDAKQETAIFPYIVHYAIHIPAHGKNVS